MKTTSFLLTVIILLTLTACGRSSAVSSKPAPASESATASQPAPPITTGLAGINAENYPRVDGSTANMPLMAALYSKFCNISPEDAETMVQTSGGTGAAWRSLLWGDVDLLLIYEAPEAVKAELEDAGIWEGLEIMPVGRDGLVFLANAQNPVESLSREQLVSVYTGEITDWSELGGTEGPIAAFQRNEESGSQTLFRKLLMKETEPMDPPSELRPMGMGELIDMVSDYDGSGGAIGFSVARRLRHRALATAATRLSTSFTR